MKKSASIEVKFVIEIINTSSWKTNFWSHETGIKRKQMYHKKNIYDNDLSGYEKHFLLLKVEDGLKKESAVELPMPQTWPARSNFSSNFQKLREPIQTKILSFNEELLTNLKGIYSTYKSQQLI